MPNPSASAIIGLARDLLRAESQSDVPVIGDAFMLKAVANADKRVLRAYRRSGGNHPTDRALEWGDELIADTAVNDSDGITTSDTTWTVDDASDFDSSGAIAFWTGGMPDIGYYTGTTSTTFTGGSGLGFAKSDNDGVQALYALPSNFGSFRRSEEYGDGVQLNGVPLTYMEGPPKPGHFSTRSDGTTTYLWLPRGATGTVSALFEKDSNTIDSVDDLISVPDDWQFVYAWRCIEMGLFGRGDYGLISLAKAKADEEQLDILKDRNVGRRVRVRPLMTIGRTYTDYLPPEADD